MGGYCNGYSQAESDDAAEGKREAAEDGELQDDGEGTGFLAETQLFIS